MKTFEQLTPPEKEKLMIYNLVQGSIAIEQSIFLAMSYALIVISLPVALLGMYFNSLIVILCGAIIALLSGLIVMVAAVETQRNKKYRQLAFGIDTQMRDIFEIKPSDIKDMRLKWVKE